MRKIIFFSLFVFLGTGLFAQNLNKDIIQRFEKTLVEMKGVETEFLSESLEKNLTATYDFSAAIDALADAVKADDKLSKIVKNNGFTPESWANAAKRIIGSVMVLTFETPEMKQQLAQMREMVNKATPEEMESNGDMVKALTFLEKLMNDFSGKPDIDAVKPFMKSLAKTMDLDLGSNAGEGSEAE